MLAHSSASRGHSSKAARAQAAADAQKWEEEAAQFEEERCQSLCPLRLQYTRELMRELDMAATAARTEREGVQAQRSALKGCLSDGQCHLLQWDLPRGYRTLLMRGLDNSKHEPALAVVGNLGGVLDLVRRDGHVCTHRDERGQTILHYCARVLSDDSSPALPHAFRQFALSLLQLLFSRCDAARVVNWMDSEGVSAASLLLTSLSASFESKLDHSKPSPVIDSFMLMREHGMAIHDVTLASGRSLLGALIDHCQVQWMLTWLAAESEDELYAIIAREAAGLQGALLEANVNAAEHPHSTPYRMLAQILHTLQSWYASNHECTPFSLVGETSTSSLINVHAELSRMLRDAPANLCGSRAVSLFTHDKNTSSSDVIALLQPGLVAPLDPESGSCMLSLAERAPGAEHNLLTHLCIELHPWKGLEPYEERIKVLLQRMEADGAVHVHGTKEISSLLARELPQRSGDVVWSVLQTLLRAHDKAREDASAAAGEVETPVTLPHAIFERCASSATSHDQAWTTIRLLLEHGITKDDRGEGFGHHFVRASNGQSQSKHTQTRSTTFKCRVAACLTFLVACICICCCSCSLARVVDLVFHLVSALGHLVASASDGCYSDAAGSQHARDKSGQGSTASHPTRDGHCSAQASATQMVRVTRRREDGRTTDVKSDDH